MLKINKSLDILSTEELTDICNKVISGEESKVSVDLYERLDFSVIIDKYVTVISPLIKITYVHVFVNPNHDGKIDGYVDFQEHLIASKNSAPDIIKVIYDLKKRFNATAKPLQRMSEVVYALRETDNSWKGLYK